MKYRNEDEETAEIAAAESADNGRQAVTSRSAIFYDAADTGIVKDKDKIKKITLNGKKIKIKSGKTSFILKLKSYKKKLKKKGKWNTLVVVDAKGNKKTLKFKTK